MAQEDDFTRYAQEKLTILSKNEGIGRLQLNKSQYYLHERLEAQRRQTGKVRAIILKGRQQGCSTYVAARFYWQAVTRNGVRVFIVTHSQDATRHIFGMVEQFHEGIPKAEREPTRIASAREKYFHERGSGYRVGTAGGRSVGRSQTVQLLHASEVAFWPRAEEHFAGMVQTVPDLPGTEIILESTACGVGNRFHRLWQEAVAGGCAYQPVFIPWFWQEDYRKEPPPEWRPDERDLEYQGLYGLDPAQIYWMGCKRKELGSDRLFMQEYPSCAEEAFQDGADDRFIEAHVIRQARHEGMREDGVEPQGARIGGCDPARFGSDRTSFCVRQGRVVLHLQSYRHYDTMGVVGLCVQYLSAWKLDKLCIDVVGLGAGVFDRLKELGFGGRILAVNGASRPVDDQKYHNKRAEMWDAMKQWLYEPPCVLPNLDSLQADLSMPGYQYTSKGCLQIERKEDMRKRGMQSPDEADALALTFAYPVCLLRADGQKAVNCYGRPETAHCQYDVYAAW